MNRIVEEYRKTILFTIASQKRPENKLNKGSERTLQ
jgi:hypothetical protein